MLDELIERLNRLEGRLLRNDPSLNHLVPFWSKSSNSLFSAYGFAFFEHDEIHDALQSCLAACRNNTIVSKVTLHALPEPELSVALEEISYLTNLQEVHVLSNNKSQSLTWHRLLPILQPSQGSSCGLRVLHVEGCVSVSRQVQVDRLAEALGQHTNLESLSMHILPRCSIQTPTLSMDSVLQALARNGSQEGESKLRSCLLTLGYDHNPYGRPMIEAQVLQEFMQATSASLERLALDNFGLGLSHVNAVAKALTTNTVLQELQLTRSLHMTLAAMQTLHASIESSNYTLRQCWIVQSGSSQTSSTTRGWKFPTTPASVALMHVQGKLSLLCRLNELGRRRLWNDTDKTEVDWFSAIERAVTETAVNADSNSLSRPGNSGVLASSTNDKKIAGASLDACYTLLRAQPQLCQTAAAPATTLKRRCPPARSGVKDKVGIALAMAPIPARRSTMTIAATRTPPSYCRQTTMQPPGILSRAEVKLRSQKHKKRGFWTNTMTPMWVPTAPARWIH